MEIETMIGQIAREIAELNGIDYNECTPVQKQTLYIKAIIKFLNIKETHEMEAEIIDCSDSDPYALSA